MRQTGPETTSVDRFAPAILLLPAIWAVHAGLLGGAIVGLPWGEAWGRLFVTGQVTRWSTGTPAGWADLVDAPHGRPFWPVDPVVQLVQVPLDALLGEATAWALVLMLL